MRMEEIRTKNGAEVGKIMAIWLGIRAPFKGAELKCAR